jgi:GNAT superfamily N-acetyltransferase
MNTPSASEWVRIESLADHLDLVETIGRWHWDEWGHSDPEGSLEAWTANLRRFTNRDRIPTTYIALEGEELLGSVSLNECDMETRRDLTPWISGVYVKPDARGRGVASALMCYAVQQAGRMGIDRLYLYTNSAAGLYEKLGWRIIGHEPYEGTVVSLMAIDVARE